MIIIEANEIPLEVFEWYANNSKGVISRTIKEFGISKTILDDVEEEYLYPSQAWASISTGLQATTHKIRWYNDAKAESDFYWRNLAKEKKHVALMNVLHSGSITQEEEKLYDFIFPDFFSLAPKVKINKYKNFQIFNHKMSVSSGRKTSKKTIILNAIKGFLKYPSFSGWGLSFRDFTKWVNIFLSLRKDSEILRNAQFVLQQRIFLDVTKVGLGKDLSVFFTNHVASCLHRNFHDLNENHINDEYKKNKIYQSMKILDEFLEELENYHFNREIILLSAMGQKLNKKVDERYKKDNAKDYKLTDHNKFLKFFGIHPESVEILYEMIPQYTFKFKDQLQLKKFINKIGNVGSDPSAMRFGYYVPSGKKNYNTQGFFCHLDIKDDQITCTMTVRPDQNGSVKLNDKKYNFEEMGFKALNVNDFHHGEHSKYGCMISFNEKLGKKEKHFTEIKNYILSKV